MSKPDFSVQKDFTFDHVSTSNTENIPTYNFGNLPVVANQGDIAFERSIVSPNLLGKLKYFDGTAWRDAAGDALTVGPVNTTPIPNGADITTNVLHLHPADTTNAGIVLPTPQTLGGDKTFVNSVYVTDPTFPVLTAPVPVASPYFPTVVNSTTGKLGSLASFPGAHFSMVTIVSPQVYNSTFSTIDLVPYANDGYVQTTSSSEITIVKSGMYIFHLSYIVGADPLSPIEFKTLMYINGTGYETSYEYIGDGVVGALINKSLNPSYFAYLTAGNVVKFDIACSSTVTMGLGNFKYTYIFGEQANV